MSILQKLTEGIVQRDREQEGRALVLKWEKTGLLEGLTSENARNGMSLLLENQAKELLREASTMAGGDVEGFAAVAFPIVRRVFGGLIANELVAVQPMSLPSGLIFFLDFQHTDSRLGYTANQSLFGGNVVGRQLSGGVTLTNSGSNQAFYNMNNGYASPTGSIRDITLSGAASGTVGAGSGSWFGDETYTSLGDRLVQYDPDLSGSVVMCASFTKTELSNFNQTNTTTISLPNISGSMRIIPHLTREDPTNSLKYMVVCAIATSQTVSTAQNWVDLSASIAREAQQVDYAVNDVFQVGGALGSVVGSTPWGLEGVPDVADSLALDNRNVDIPEIDIKVDSIAVTAITKKLKAKWSPELGQDLNAYHNLDAEVELTSILSEQIALEIDREILIDLINGARNDSFAGVLYWSRRPGWFVDRETGQPVHSTTAPPDFTGNVSEWYETLIETVNDLSARIHRATLRGGANFLVVSPEMANILEFTKGFRADVTGDEDKGVAGAVKVGSISRKFDIYVDPYFHRNVILVGRKGSGFLESGYVYAPYVPLQVTPTIFGIEDFVPRKGVMTRYAKKMVRPDMYGLVIVQHMVG